MFVRPPCEYWTPDTKSNTMCGVADCVRLGGIAGLTKMYYTSWVAWLSQVRERTQMS